MGVKYKEKPEAESSKANLAPRNALQRGLRRNGQKGRKPRWHHHNNNQDAPLGAVSFLFTEEENGQRVTAALSRLTSVNSHPGGPHPKSLFLEPLDATGSL